MVRFVQPLSCVARLTGDDLKIEQERAHCGSATPVRAAEPLAGHARELVRWRRSLAALPAHERWLFPGASPGRPIGGWRSAADCAVVASTAPRIAAPRCSSFPAMCPPRCWPTLLGVHINTATRWAELTGRHQTSYLTLRQGG